MYAVLENINPIRFDTVGQTERRDRGGFREGGPGDPNPPPIPMNDDVIHTELYAVKPLSVRPQIRVTNILTYSSLGKNEGVGWC